LLKYLLTRLWGAVITLFVIVTVSFFMMKAAPGGPFSRERSFPPEVLKNIEAKYNLDKPVWVQYGLYLKRIVIDFDLGPSTRYADRSVNELVKSGFDYSLKIGLGALAVALFVGLLAGIIAALRHNTWIDYLSMSGAMIGVSMPDFVLANLLILIFAIGLEWLPVARVENAWGYVLPCATLGLTYAASIARLTRGGMLEILNQDFVRTAYAKGLPKRIVIWRHTLKGGLLPVVSYLGPAIAGMLTGSLIVEKFFSIPGLGWFLVDSAINRDYTLSMGATIVYAALLIVMNIIVDLFYGFMDPRITYR
jgi:oligopeptide transport system permease protein